MKSYFVLQFRLLWRGIAAFGLHPFLGVILIVALFLGGYIYLAQYMDQAHLIYAALGLSFLTKLNSKRRDEFLMNIFKKKQFRVVRMSENLLLALPFLIILSLDLKFIVAGALLIAAVLMCVMNLGGQRSGQKSLPTPYSKWPFEFAVGFRKTWFLLPLVVFLIVMSGLVPNFGLGVFAMIITTLMCMFYYAEQEHEHYVWMHALSPSAFLFRKIRIALFYFSLTILPQVIALIAIFPDRWWVFLSIFGLASILMASAVLARYSNYPHEIGVSQGMMYALCLIFPPMLLVIMPYFYSHSVECLKPYLK